MCVCVCVCFVGVLVHRPINNLGLMETGPQLKFSFNRLVKPRIEPVTPGLQGE